MHEEFISQLHVYAKAIGILLKGYLPISLFPPSKLQEILGELRKVIQITNPDYDSHKKTSTILWYEISYLWN